MKDSKDEEGCQTGRKSGQENVGGYENGKRDEVDCFSSTIVGECGPYERLDAREILVSPEIASRQVIVRTAIAKKTMKTETVALIVVVEVSKTRSKTGRAGRYMAPDAGPRKAAAVTMLIIRILRCLEKAVYGDGGVKPLLSSLWSAMSLLLSLDEIAFSRTAGSSFAVFRSVEQSFSVSHVHVDCSGEEDMLRWHRGALSCNDDGPENI